MTENKLNKPIYLMIYIALMVLALFGCTDNGEYTLHLFYPPDGGFDWIQGFSCFGVAFIFIAVVVFHPEELSKSDNIFLISLSFIAMYVGFFIWFPLPPMLS